MVEEFGQHADAGGNHGNFVEVFVPEAEIDPLDIIVKTEQDPITLDDLAVAELNLALNDSSDIEKEDNPTYNDDNDEQEEIIFEGEVPRPIWSTDDLIVKHEDDIVSGNLAFAIRVCVFLHYQINY